jgi:hypothetical protein
VSTAWQTRNLGSAVASEKRFLAKAIEPVGHQRNLSRSSDVPATALPSSEFVTATAALYDAVQLADGLSDVLPTNELKISSVPTGQWQLWRFQIPRSTQPISARLDFEFVSGLAAVLYLHHDVQPTPDKFKHRVVVNSSQPKVRASVEQHARWGC